jgi:hypothetical protein
MGREATQNRGKNQKPIGPHFKIYFPDESCFGDSKSFRGKNTHFFSSKNSGLISIQMRFHNTL